MALKPDRKYTDGTDISYFMNATAERGGIVAFSSGGSGVAMDDDNAVVVPTGSTVSGVTPAGLLLNDMVNLDLTRQHINQHQDQIQLGGKVTVLRHGEVTTNVLDTGSTPTIGAAAYFATQTFGSYSNFYVLSTTSTNSTRVGTFKSVADADGYVKVEINML